MLAARVAFIGPTGSGKTTAAAIVSDLVKGTVNIKLAQPLYHMQNCFYSYVGRNCNGGQDGELLQFLGYKIQREAPCFLADQFEIALRKVIHKVPIVTNDDCRAHNYSHLARLGFTFVRVNGIARARDDHSPVDPSHPVEAGLDDCPSQYELNNTGTIDECRDQVAEIVHRLVGQRGFKHPTYRTL